MNKGKLVILSAPSGTGKTSICRELVKRNKNWKFSVSATTREKRKGEINGRDYPASVIKEPLYDPSGSKMRS